jgi:hypothetical protein
VPNEDETLNEIEPNKPTKVSTFPTETTTEQMPTTTPTPTVKTTNTPSTTTEKPLNRTELRDADFFSENGSVLIRDPKLSETRNYQFFEI